MKISTRVVTAAALCGLSSLALAADKKPKGEEKAAAIAATQPATESLDLAMYSRIRDEGFFRSHIMEYAGALFDDIGPRLTGSPAMAPRTTGR